MPLDDSISSFTLPYLFEDSVSAPPTIGRIRFNNVDPKQVTQVMVSKTDLESLDRELYLLAGSFGKFFKVFSTSNPDFWVIYKIGLVSDPGNYFVYDTIYVASEGSVVNGDAIGFTLAASSTGGGGGSTTWLPPEVFIITAEQAANNQISISQQPILYSEIVVGRGLVLTRGIGYDYTISGTLLTFESGYLVEGEKISVRYQV